MFILSVTSDPLFEATALKLGPSRQVSLIIVTLSLNSLALLNSKILIDALLQQLARQAPAARDTAGACLAGYCSL